MFVLLMWTPDRYWSISYCICLREIEHLWICPKWYYVDLNINYPTSEHNSLSRNVLVTIQVKGEKSSYPEATTRSQSQVKYFAFLLKTCQFSAKMCRIVRATPVAQTLSMSNDLPTALFWRWQLQSQYLGQKNRDKMIKWTVKKTEFTARNAILPNRKDGGRRWLV